MTATVVVAVVSHNSADDLPGLLASLPTGMGREPWHLVVADNASSDDSVDVVRRTVPGATVVEMGRNAGYAAGVNAAVAAAPPHTAVLVLNADVRLDPGCVPTLRQALEQPGTGIAVPRLVDAQGRLIASMRREPTVLRAVAGALVGARHAGRHPRLGEVVTDERAYDEAAVVDWAEGSTQLVSRECWERCGPWDESFFLYSEETDFDLRARDAGFATRYVPTATATHLEGGSATSVRLWPLLVVNQVRLFRRRNGLPSTCAFWAANLAREVSRGLLGRASARAAARALLSPSRMRARPGPEWIGGAR